MRLFALCLTAILFTSLPAQAQQTPGGVPELPEPIQSLVADGAQVRYLGTVNGLEGWVTIFRGQEQYFYVTPDKKNFVMGLLFDETGSLVTVNQVQRLREREGEVLDLLTEDRLPLQPNSRALAESDATSLDVVSPAQQMYRDFENSNWITLGNPQAPAIYVVIDPQCPHCHAFLQDLRAPVIESGLLQVRLVPIGLRPETEAQSAFLLAAPDPSGAWFAHLDGDTAALPAPADINTQGVKHNLAVIQTWQLDATPFTIYRDRAGEVKLIRGRADNIEQIISDITG